MQKSDSFFTNLKNHSITQKFLKTVYETPIEVFIGAITFGAAGLGIGLYNERSEANAIPLAFSEIGQTTRMYRREEKDVPVFTQFYSLTNDITMKVFEAKNLSHQWNSPFRDDNEGFAYELEKKIEPTLRVHATISEHASKLPELSKNALINLKKLTDTQGELVALTTEFPKIWDESHTDIYRTEYDIKTKCDSTGKNCVTTKTPKEVYHHTDHEYDYHPKHGTAAASLLAGFAINHPDLKINEDLVLVTSTGADNENAINHSMKKFKDRYPTAEEYIEASNIWAKGCNLSVYLPNINENHAKMLAFVETMNQIQSTARDVSYPTYFHFDDGPEEYRATNQISGAVTEVDASISNITNGIKYAGENALILDQKIKDFVNITLHHQKGDADQLHEDIMKIAQTMYQQNFHGGVDVNPFEFGKVLLWTLGGIALGAAAGAAVDKGIDQYRKTNKFTL